MDLLVYLNYWVGFKPRDSDEYKRFGPNADGRLFIHKKIIKILPYIIKYDFSDESNLNVISEIKGYVVLLKPIKNRIGKELCIKTESKLDVNFIKTFKKHYVEIDFLYGKEAENYVLIQKRLDKIKSFQI